MWGQDGQGSTIGMKQAGPVFRELLQTLARLDGSSNRFVVHVGDVADVEGLHSRRLHHSAKHVLYHKSAEVADMRATVNRRPATIETETPTIHRFECLDRSGQRIVQINRTHEEFKKGARQCDEIEKSSVSNKKDDRRNA